METDTNPYQSPGTGPQAIREELPPIPAGIKVLVVVGLVVIAFVTFVIANVLADDLGEYAALAMWLSLVSGIAIYLPIGAACFGLVLRKCWGWWIAGMSGFLPLAAGSATGIYTLFRHGHFEIPVITRPGLLAIAIAISVGTTGILYRKVVFAAYRISTAGIYWQIAIQFLAAVCIDVVTIALSDLPPHLTPFR